VGLGTTKIMVIPWALGEWDKPIPDHPPKVLEFQSNSKDRFSFFVPRGRLLRVYAINHKLGLVSAVHLRVAPGQALKLNLFPASKLHLPSAKNQEYTWTLLGNDPESGRPYLFGWGKVTLGSTRKTLLLPPGRFRLRMIRRKASSATLSLALAPKQVLKVHPQWEKPALLFPKNLDPQNQETLLLPPLFSPPMGATLPLSQPVLRIPTLQGLVLRSWIQKKDGSIQAIDLGPFHPGERRTLEAPKRSARELRIRLPLEAQGSPYSLELLWWDLGRRVRRNLGSKWKGEIIIHGIPRNSPLLLILENDRGQVSFLSSPSGKATSQLKPNPKPSAGLDLQVFSPDGMPAGGNKIRVLPLEIQGLNREALTLLGPWNRWTNPQGRLQLRGLPEGEYRIHILPGLHNELEKRIQLSAKKITRMSLHLKTGFHLEGQVLNSRGEPVPGALVKLLSETLPPTVSPRTVTTDVKGHFQFLSLGKGPFSLEAILVRGSKSFFARRRGVHLGEKKTILLLKPEDPKDPFNKKDPRD
jgi:hypothetical protein